MKMTNTVLVDRLNTDQAFRNKAIDLLVETLVDKMEIEDLVEQLSWYMTESYKRKSGKELMMEVEDFDVDLSTLDVAVV